MQFQINQINQRDFVVFFLWETNFYRSNNNLHGNLLSTDGRRWTVAGRFHARRRASPGVNHHDAKWTKRFAFHLIRAHFFKKARAFRRVHVGRALSFFIFIFTDASFLLTKFPPPSPLLRHGKKAPFIYFLKKERDETRHRWHQLYHLFARRDLKQKANKKQKQMKQ